MITKEITKREFHFDNPEERKDCILTMKRLGYKILSSGKAEDWYFVCEKED